MLKKNYSDSDLKQLVEGFSKGDVASFSALYDWYIEKIYRFIYFKVAVEDAEDLTEVTFIKAWENRKKYDSKKSAFSSWLYTIARNTVIDHYRVSKPVETLTEEYVDNDDNHPKYLAEQSLLALQVREAINTLPENYRDVLLLKFIDDLGYREIADILNKSEGAVRVLQFRGLKELKKVLQKIGINE